MACDLTLASGQAPRHRTLVGLLAIAQTSFKSASPLQQLLLMPADSEMFRLSARRAWYSRSATQNKHARSYAARISTPGSTVSDAVVEQLASQPMHKLTLSDLVNLGQPPLTPAALFRSANFSLSILPTRLAHRIQALRDLPYVVVTNPHVAQIHQNYIKSLSILLPYAEQSIDSREKEAQFTEVMTKLVQTHTNTIPILARGFLETRKYISPAHVTKFLDEHLRARIGTRLIAEQHIALHQSTLEAEKNGGQSHQHSNYIGIIDTALKPASIVRSCESFVSEICELNYGVRPRVVIDGEPDATITHIPMHLEYVITELLKNAFRAVIERRAEREPIEVTIAPARETPLAPKHPAQHHPHDISPASKEKNSAADSISDTTSSPTRTLPHDPDASNEITVSYSDIQPPAESTPGMTIRIRDRGGGIAPENYQKIWNYSFTTFDDRQASRVAAGLGSQGSGMDGLSTISAASAGTSAAGGSTLAGLGYGLPLGRAYAEYFGGGIAVQSLYGWGADVYLTLRGVVKKG